MVEIKNAILQIKPKKEIFSELVLIYKSYLPFKSNDKKTITEFFPYLKFNNNRYINLVGIEEFSNSSIFVKITNEGKKFTLIILPLNEFKIEMTAGNTPFGGISGKIDDSNDRYKDLQNKNYKIFYIDETKLEKNYIFKCDAFSLKRGRLKEILKENNITADVKEIK